MLEWKASSVFIRKMSLSRGEEEKFQVLSEAWMLLHRQGLERLGCCYIGRAWRGLDVVTSAGPGEAWMLLHRQGLERLGCCLVGSIAGEAKVW